MLLVAERGVHAASTRERQGGLGDSDAPALRTPKRAESPAPNGTGNLWMPGSVSFTFVGGAVAAAILAAVEDAHLAIRTLA